MCVTTVFNKPENATTGDEELDVLLTRARELSGRNWQCDVTTGWKRTWYGKIVIGDNYYTLLVFVDGVLPWQEIICGSGDLDKTKAFLYGYINGLTHKANKDV